MKHIFTSKDSLNNARCRSIRQLEAELDSQESSRVHLERTNEVSVAKTHPAKSYMQGKDVKRSPMAESQETRSIAGEEHLHRYMPVIADNPPALLFCDYLGNPCQNRVCFNNKYCGLKAFLDIKQKAENLGYEWGYLR